MGLQISDQKNVDLIAGQLTMEQSPDMNLFNIVGYRFIAYSSKKELRMTIVMRRKIMSEMMTTYFPSLLLMMITFATTFFKPFFFEAALSVNLTNMLVMTTTFMSVMERLPTTSYLKMVDIWLVFCQLVPFTEVKDIPFSHLTEAFILQVILLTIIEHVREESITTEEQPAEKGSIDSARDKTAVLEGGKEAWTEKGKYIQVGSKLWICGLQALGNS